MTRHAESRRARALALLGAEVVQGDMGDPASLRPIFAGAYGVYSVQNTFSGGPEAEIRQGKHVADVAKESAVQHIVYGSAGVGRESTGIPSWDTKLAIEAHMKALALPLTILRPTAFMELMTDKKFFPAVGTWRVMPRLMGPSRPLPWICVDDLGAIAACAFADPQRFVGADLRLASDVQSLAQCRSLYCDVMGTAPPQFPMLVWLFQRLGFVGRDLTTMWRWLRTADLDLDTAPTRALHLQALTVQAWLGKQQAARSASA